MKRHICSFGSAVCVAVVVSGTVNAQSAGALTWGHPTDWDGFLGTGRKGSGDTVLVAGFLGNGSMEYSSVLMSVSTQPTILDTILLPAPRVSDDGYNLIERLPDGGLLVGGYSYNGINYNMLVARLSATNTEQWRYYTQVGLPGWQRWRWGDVLWRADNNAYVIYTSGTIPFRVLCELVEGTSGMLTRQDTLQHEFGYEYQARAALLYTDTTILIFGRATETASRLSSPLIAVADTQCNRLQAIYLNIPGSTDGQVVQARRFSSGEVAFVGFTGTEADLSSSQSVDTGLVGLIDNRGIIRWWTFLPGAFGLYSIVFNDVEPLTFPLALVAGEAWLTADSSRPFVGVFNFNTQDFVFSNIVAIPGADTLKKAIAMAGTQMGDGGFLLAGIAEIAGISGYWDAILIKTDGEGKICNNFPVVDSVSIQPATSVRVGDSLTLTVSYTGGTGTATCVWAGAVTATTCTVQTTAPSAAGKYSATVKVTDANGCASGVFAVELNVECRPIDIVYINLQGDTVTSDVIYPGDSVVLIAVVEGAPTYSCVWNGQDTTCVLGITAPASDTTLIFTVTIDQPYCQVTLRDTFTVSRVTSVVKALSSEGAAPAVVWLDNTTLLVKLPAQHSQPLTISVMLVDGRTPLQRRVAPGVQFVRLSLPAGLQAQPLIVRITGYEPVLTTPPPGR